MEQCVFAKSMPPQLDVSVIIPCFNAHETLERCIESVARQTCYPCEIVIVDDGSDVPIGDLIEKLRSFIDVPIKFLSQPNSGAPAARNAAIEVASGKYLAFLDADDIWLPDKLKIQYALMEKHNLLLSGHGYAFNDVDSVSKTILTAVKSRHIRRLSFVYGNPLFTPTVMVRRDEFCGFDERFRRVDDYMAWLKNFQSGRCSMIEAVLAAGFKPPIGHSGLTGSIDAMHLAHIDVLDALFAERQIGCAFYWLARMIEAAKFPIRRRAAKMKRSEKFLI